MRYEKNGAPLLVPKYFHSSLCWSHCVFCLSTGFLYFPVFIQSLENGSAAICFAGGTARLDEGIYHRLFGGYSMGVCLDIYGKYDLAGRGKLDSPCGNLYGV